MYVWMKVPCNNIKRQKKNELQRISEQKKKKISYAI